MICVQNEAGGPKPAEKSLQFGQSIKQIVKIFFFFVWILKNPLRYYDAAMKDKLALALKSCQDLKIPKISRWRKLKV